MTGGGDEAGNPVLTFWLGVTCASMRSSSSRCRSPGSTPPGRRPVRHSSPRSSWRLPGGGDVLFGRARAWFSTVFNDADAVLDLGDPTARVLAGKALFRYKGGAAIYGDPSGVVRFTVRVEVKDDRYRLTIGRFEHDALDPVHAVNFGLLRDVEDLTADQCVPRVACTAKKWRVQTWTNLKAAAMSTSASLAASLEAAMKPAASSDDW